MNVELAKKIDAQIKQLELRQFTPGTVKGMAHAKRLAKLRVARLAAMGVEVAS